MSGNVVIRPIELPEDGELLLALHRMADGDSGFGREEGEVEALVDYITRHQDIYTCMAMLIDDEPAGYIRCYERISTSSCDRVLMLDIVQIAEAYRGQGHGRAMIEMLLRFAESEGFARIDLLADADNKAAIALYDSFGFKGRLRFQMHKFLKSSPQLDAYFEAKKRRDNEGLLK